MRLFHGSSIVVSEPRIGFSRSNLDFGRGFYATSIRTQAERWAKRKAFLDNSSTAIVSEFELGDLASLKTLEFKEPDADWVDFVCHCRRGGSQYKGYDLIIGGVADDKVYEAVSMYFKGLWDMETTLDALRFYEVNDQYCFVTQKAIDETLAFVASHEVRS